MQEEPFVITAHQTERVLEVMYPARPTLRAYERYDAECRAAILQFEQLGTWHCLVDQSKVVAAMAPDLPPRISDLIAWSRPRRLGRVARVLSASELGRLQSRRILRAAGLDGAQLFEDRAAAWAYVVGASNDDS